MSDYTVQLVELHEGSKNLYKLNKEGLEKTLGRADLADKKVAVISIAGAFRKGKSFLLNFLVTYLEHLHNGGKGEWFNEKTTLDKFHWRGGADRDTNGIFIWSVPYILEDQNGEDVVIFLMDTQGTFDHQSTVQDCATIFALSTLVSSVQIFNVSSQIQEDDLNNLRFFTEYARLTKDENEQEAPFQKLLFLVRDWMNSDQYEYGYDGGKEYLEKLLKTEPKQKKELKRLRENIKASFENLEAFLMPHPGLRIARNNSEMVLGHVEEEFAKQLDNFVPSLFETGYLESKKLGGNEITCRELVELIKAWMQHFNSDELPEPKTILDATVEAVNLASEQKARGAYDEHMKKNFTGTLSNLATLQSLCQAAETVALEIFSVRPKFGEESAAKVNKDNLAKYFATRHVEYKRTVEQNLRMEEEKRRVEAEKKRIAAEQEAERLRIKAEEERIRREKAENERRQREEAERLRRQREEQERRQREEAERLRRQREEQERRQREEAERQRQEAERLRRQREEQERRQREEAERQRQEAESLRRQREEQARQQREYEAKMEREREEMARFRAEIQRQAMYSPPSYNTGGWGSSVSPPSFSTGGGGRSDGVREVTFMRRGREVTAYRGSDGRFCKKPSDW